VDGTGSGSCPMADFGISGVQPSGSATTALFTLYLSCIIYRYIYIYVPRSMCKYV
jgi:hypothetical protein